MRLTPKRLAPLLFALCASCAHTVTGPNARCSQLIPADWAKGVEGFPVPDGNALSDWQAGFVGQAGQLEKANGRTSDTITIIKQCEALVNASRK